MNVVELHVVILDGLCPLPLSHGKNLGPVVRKVDNGIHPGYSPDKSLSSG